MFVAEKYHLNRLLDYKSSMAYVVLILCLNIAYSYFPVIYWHHEALSSADVLAGTVYLMRDFAQRELNHYVIIAMLIAAVLSYLLASPLIALASVTAFMIGEFIDWALFTFTRRNLSSRLLISSCISVPLDTIVFLFMLHQLNLAGFFIMNVSKWFGIIFVWVYWFVKYYQTNARKRSDVLV